MSNIFKGSGIIYTTGVPNTIPNQGTDAEFAIDVNGVQYAWNRNTNVWDNMGQGIEIATSSAVPTHTPSNFRPRFLITPSRDFYFYSGSWGKVGALPSNLFSSSAQIGPTGIYSGSGEIPNGNAATLIEFEGNDNYSVKMLFDKAGEYQTTFGDGFSQFGVESYAHTEEIFTFAGFEGGGNQSLYQIYSIDTMVNSASYLSIQPYGTYFAGNLIELSTNGQQNSIQVFNNQITVRTDSRRGIQYNGNYTSSFTTSSLIDRRYADKHIAFSSSAAATSASLLAGRGGVYNGSGVVQSNTYTSTDAADDYNFRILYWTSGYYQSNYASSYKQFGVESVNEHTGLFAFAGFQAGGDEYKYVIYSKDELFGGSAELRVEPGTITAAASEFNLSLNDGGTFGMNSSGFLFDPPSGTAIGYSNDVSEYYTDRSFVDKEYVDRTVSRGFRTVTSSDVSGSKGDYHYYATFSNTVRKFLFRDLMLSNLYVQLESGSYVDGTEVELIFNQSTVTDISYSDPFNLMYTYVPILSVTGVDYRAIKFAYDSPTDKWVLVNHSSI